jgi:hypothetical protein
VVVPGTDKQHLSSIFKAQQEAQMDSPSASSPRANGFASQAKLFSWLDRSKTHDLKRTRTITLRLTDIQLSSLCDPVASTRGGSGQASAWNLYQQELERLDETLRSLPHLEQLTLVPPDRSKSTFVKAMYESFLDAVVVRCPKLKRLVLYDDAEVLSRVPALKRLPKVFCEGSLAAATVPGASRSPPEETLDGKTVKTESVADDAEEC